MNKKSLIIFLLILAVIAAAGWAVLSHKKQPAIVEQPVACTMDAKICPDGSAVGRTGPNCEFTACPELKESNVAKLNQRIFSNGIYITPVEVVADSRCPSGVQCIWAGIVSLKLKLENPSDISKNATMTLNSDKSIVFAGKKITLKNVTPTPVVNKVVPPESYQFTFEVTKNSHDDLIKVSAPAVNAVITSPLVVKGTARGNWYFEASFPVRLLDGNGKEISVTPAQAQGEWMTTNFVPFTATLKFDKPSTPTGTLILQKDNPSGLPENEDQISIPVRF